MKVWRPVRLAHKTTNVLTASGFETEVGESTEKDRNALLAFSRLPDFALDTFAPRTEGRTIRGFKRLSVADGIRFQDGIAVALEMAKTKSISVSRSSPDPPSAYTRFDYFQDINLIIF